MCSACEDEAIAPYIPTDRELVRRAREIEARLPGERVPEAAWDIYFNFAGGAIAWRDFQRIQQSHRDAVESAPPSRKTLGRTAQPRRLPICAEIAS